MNYRISLLFLITFLFQLSQAVWAPIAGIAGGATALGAIGVADKNAEKARIYRERNIMARKRKLKEMAEQLQRLQTIWAQLVRDDPVLAQRLIQNPQGALALMQQASQAPSAPIPYQA